MLCSLQLGVNRQMVGRQGAVTMQVGSFNAGITLNTTIRLFPSMTLVYLSEASLYKHNYSR
jgi:hypothetical protein